MRAITRGLLLLLPGVASLPPVWPISDFFLAIFRLTRFRPFGGQKIEKFKISRKGWGIKGNTRRPEMKPLGPSVYPYGPWGLAARLARDTAHFGPKLGHFGALFGVQKSKISKYLKNGGELEETSGEQK